MQRFFDHRNDVVVALRAATITFVVFAALLGASRVAAAGEETAAAAGNAEEFAATVHERPSPLVFRVARGALDARRRANDASTALRTALEEPVADAALAEVQVSPSGTEATVLVLGRTVATLTEADASVVGSSLPQYSAELETRLVTFVEEEQQRSTIQAFALRIFLTVLFAVLGFLTLRALRTAFSRWDVAAETDAPAPIHLAGVPLLSSDARKALTAVAMMAARWLAYGGVVVIVVAASLSQFERTRPWLTRAVDSVVDPLLNGFDALVGALPGVALAIVLLILLRAGLEFLRLLLEGVAQGRVTSTIVRPERALPARFFVTAVAVLLVAPLAAAAAFGRFGAPLETLALAAGACALLALVPMTAAASVGLMCLWRGNIKPGDWISVGNVEGEVSSVGLLDFVIVPHDGGAVAVPMLVLLLRPTLRTSSARTDVVLELKRGASFEKTMAALLAVVRSVDEHGSVALIEARGDVLTCRARVALAKGDVRDTVLRALLVVVERGELELHSH